jgi:hypothetical protein
MPTKKKKPEVVRDDKVEASSEDQPNTESTPDEPTKVSHRAFYIKLIFAAVLGVLTVCFLACAVAYTIYVLSANSANYQTAVPWVLGIASLVGTIMLAKSAAKTYRADFKGKIRVRNIVITIVSAAFVTGAVLATVLILTDTSYIPEYSNRPEVSTSEDEPEDKSIDEPAASRPVQKYAVSRYDYQQMSSIPEALTQLVDEQKRRDDVVDVAYYKVADLQDDFSLYKIVFQSMSSLAGVGLLFNDNYLITGSEGDISLVGNSYMASYTEYYGLKLITAEIDGIRPQSYQYNGVMLTADDVEISDYNYFGQGYLLTGQEALISQAGDWRLYELKKPPADNYVNVQSEYFLMSPDNRKFGANVPPKVARNDGSFDITWNIEYAASEETQVWMNPARGCSANSGQAILSFTPATSQLQRVGTLNANGRPVYKVINYDAFIQKIYNDDLSSDMKSQVSFNEFNNNLNNIVYQDDFGQYLLFVNSKYAGAAECGKPVIYLYPQQTTILDVKVGAEVRLSDPFYQKDTGWQAVIARPDGQLSYRGNTYDSLYWEGLGHGAYPNVSDRGVVVPQKDLISTIKAQLFAQGLNQKEATDFLEFWRGNLPKNNFVKLAWLTTEEMNTLAPLYISQKPDTLIRVFLDARGYDVYPSSLKLTPQVFNAPLRQGFVAVEWGGLLQR